MSPRPIVLVVRARRALARPALRRLAVVALALATAVAVVTTLGAAGAARDHWGRTRPVAVATRDLAPGQVVAAGDIEVRDLPAALVGEAALADAPVGAVVRHPVLAGEPVAAARLGAAGGTGPAALLEAGELAVAVPLGPAGAPPLAVGDRVDVLTVLAPDAAAASGDDPAFALVAGATVVDVAEQAVTVAVPAGDAARVAWAVGNAAVVLALAGP